MQAYLKSFYEWCRSAYPIPSRIQITEAYAVASARPAARGCAVFIYQKAVCFLPSAEGARGYILALEYNKDRWSPFWFAAYCADIPRSGGSGHIINRRRLKARRTVSAGMLQLHALYTARYNDFFPSHSSEGNATGAH
jgi:hypothetical protein